MCGDFGRFCCFILITVRGDWMRGLGWETYMSISDDLFDDSPDMMVHKQRGVSLDYSLSRVNEFNAQRSDNAVKYLETYFRVDSQGACKTLIMDCNRVQCRPSTSYNTSLDRQTTQSSHASQYVFKFIYLIDIPHTLSIMH